MGYIYVRKYYEGVRKESWLPYFAPGVLFDGCGGDMRDDSTERRSIK